MSLLDVEIHDVEGFTNPSFADLLRQPIDAPVVLETSPPDGIVMAS